MIFRFIFLIAFSISAYSQSFFDRFYIFGEWNKQLDSQDIVPDYDELVGGILIDKGVDFGDSYKAYISWYLKSAENTNDKSKMSSIIRELYFQTQISNMQASIGKEIIDLSKSKIYSINTFLSPISSILNPLDRSLQSYGLEGITISDDLEAFNAKWLFYLYKGEIFNDNSNDKLRGILSVKQVNDFMDNDFFAGFNKDGEFFLATGLSFVISQEANFYAETKYEDSRFNHVIGFDYVTPNGISVALERIIKDENIPNEILVIENNTTKIKTNALNFGLTDNLEGEHYVGLYARVPYNNLNTGSILALYNMMDESKMFALQNEYSFGAFKAFIQYVKNIGSSKKNTEFERKSSHIFQISLAIDLLSDNTNEEEYPYN